MTPQTAIIAALPALRAAGVDDAVGDARRIMAHVLGVDAGRLILMAHDPLADGAAQDFNRLVARRVRREPISHITGQRAFYGRMFQVTADVLDPRPDTETLVSLALETPFDRVLDLGTGSGCILLTLLAEMGPGAQGLGLDISDAALGVARQNAAALGLADRAAFARSDWFDAANGPYDLIVSNPPYIDADELPSLAPEVRLFEPEMALSPGADGTAPYRVIAAGAMTHLRPGGRLLVEIGHRQGAAVAQIFRAAGLASVDVQSDIDGRDRVVRGLRPA